MPPLPTPQPTVVQKATELLTNSNSYSGEIYTFMIFIFVGIILMLFIFWLIIKIWGNPIMVAKVSHSSGEAIIQHFENSKIGTLKLAEIGGGAIRHRKIADGTLIAIPKGINNLDGHSFVNSWNLTGISVPPFLMGAITKLRQYGYLTRQILEDAISQKPTLKDANLITEAYDFNDFKDIEKKSKISTLIPLEIEHTNSFIEPVNQHYTEADITKEVKSYFMGIPDNFIQIYLMTCIGIFIVAIAIYFLMGVQLGGK